MLSTPRLLFYPFTNCLGAPRLPWIRHRSFSPDVLMLFSPGSKLGVREGLVIALVNVGPGFGPPLQAARPFWMRRLIIMPP